MDKQPDRLEPLWFFFKQYKLQVLILVVSSLAVGALEAATVALVYPILTAAFESGLVRDNIVLYLFSTMANLLPVADKFIAYCLLFLILAIMAFMVKFWSIRYRNLFSGRLVENSQKDIFRKFIQADYQYFIDHKQGELVYNTTTAPLGLQTLISSATDFLAQVILSISVFLLLLSLSWQGTLAVLLMGLAYYFFTGYLAQKVSYSSGKAQLEAGRESNIVLAETIGGIKQLKVFVTAEDWLNRFARIIKSGWYHYIRLCIWQQTLNPILIFILYIFVGVIAIIIRALDPGSFSALIPVFGTFAFAVFRLVPLVGGISSDMLSVTAALPNCEIVYQTLRQKLTNIEDGNKELDSFKSRIEFDNVSFGYPGREKVLEGITITFEKGKTTAVVGRSGSGKTTIVNLLLRLFDVDGGEIKIDGVNIKQYKTASWLSKIGFVSEDTFIFNNTIRNNITFGSTYSEEQMITAAKYADAHSFIIKLPDGYDTLVGDKGMRLSAGQRQRIAVARAMIRSPQILIFDEATNALDNISESAVQKAIDEIAQDHTVIIIAHRLSTIANADKIIVLEDRRVLEEGTHKELMAKGGAYYSLYMPKSDG